MKKFVETVVPYLISLVLGLLKPERIRGVADQLLDWVEFAVKRTDNGYDDALILPLTVLVRNALKIEDL